MTLVAVSKWKQVECDDCGRVSSVIAWIPIKFACCGSCGSLRIRRYYTEDERKERLRQRRIRRTSAIG